MVQKPEIKETGPVLTDAAAEAIKDVRNDSTPTTWAALTYENNKSENLVVLATGTGGANELTAQLSNDKVAYAIIRKIEKIDNTEAVKFCYIRWVGEGIPVMKKAKIGATAGEVADFFRTFHVTP